MSVDLRVTTAVLAAPMYDLVTFAQSSGFLALGCSVQGQTVCECNSAPKHPPTCAACAQVSRNGLDAMMRRAFTELVRPSCALLMHIPTHAASRLKLCIAE